MRYVRLTRKLIYIELGGLGVGLLGLSDFSTQKLI